MEKKLNKRTVVLEARFVIILMTIALFGCFPRTSYQVPTDQPVQETNVMSPDDFKSLLAGKTKLEVREIMGTPPNGVRQNFATNDPTGSWFYAGTRSHLKAQGKYIYDPIVGKNVKMVIINFKDEVVEKVDVSF